MAYDEILAERIAIELDTKKVIYEEKKMFGGLVFMVDDKMCIGVVKERLMARIDPDLYHSAIKRKGAAPMDFTGQRMKGFVYVNPEGLDMDEDLEYWIEKCLEYNPKAQRSSTKKKK